MPPSLAPAPIPPSTSALSAPTSQSASRSRPQQRKKPNDDAAYTGPPQPAGSKRLAGERLDEPRVKRKRVDRSDGTTGSGVAMTMMSARERAANLKAGIGDSQGRVSLIDFNTLPISALYHYLFHFNIIPTLRPSPLTALDPPPPSSLLLPPRPLSPPPLPAITPANRPRRDRDSHQRDSHPSSTRLRSRMLSPSPSQDAMRTRIPILSDVADVRGVLATLVERHFREEGLGGGVGEVEVMQAFLGKVRYEEGECVGEVGA